MTEENRPSRDKKSHGLLQRKSSVTLGKSKKLSNFSLIDPLNGISGLGAEHDRKEEVKKVLYPPFRGGEMHSEQADGNREFGETVIDYIRRKYGKEIDDGTFKRIDLKKREGKSLYSSYASWISPGRHPEDALWPESDGRRRDHKESLDILSPEKRVLHTRALGAARQKKYESKENTKIFAEEPNKPTLEERTITNRYTGKNLKLG